MDRWGLEIKHLETDSSHPFSVGMQGASAGLVFRAVRYVIGKPTPLLKSSRGLGGVVASTPCSHAASCAPARASFITLISQTNYMN